jgi:SAM-dependent methyltransferase
MAERVRSPGNLRFYLDYLFEGVDLTGKSVLDVGASGGGRYSLYAACQGAREVVSLEALDSGSTATTVDDFGRALDLLRLRNVELVSGRLQDLDLGEERFDVLLLYASINHLDEDACIRLHRDPRARARYRELLGALARAAAPGARLIAVDCSPRNLLGRFGKNPLAPSIEWHKHQPPELWATLLEEVGFARPRIRWNSVNTLRTAGRLLLGNRFAAYCLTSVFCLTMEREAGGVPPGR